RLRAGRGGSYDGRRAAARSGFLALRNRLERVPDAVARLDERVPGRAPVDLVAQLAHEDVHRPVTVPLAAAPDALPQLVAGDHSAAVEGEHVEQPELGRGQPDVLAVDVRLHFARVDVKLLDIDRLAAIDPLRPRAAARGRLHTRDQLGHGEGLDEVIVRA